jgi:hypothetical protein
MYEYFHCELKAELKDGHEQREELRDGMAQVDRERQNDLQPLHKSVSDCSREAGQVLSGSSIIDADDHRPGECDEELVESDLAQSHPQDAEDALALHLLLSSDIDESICWLMNVCRRGGIDERPQADERRKVWIIWHC